ncbi:MAG: HAMP domain-containing histidine kinase [Nanoarchaeota archaeon]|nr:HAMP domain-containing histidine kinase [Nanoarchaeota archaeon]
MDDVLVQIDRLKKQYDEVSKKSLDQEVLAKQLRHDIRGGLTRLDMLVGFLEKEPENGSSYIPLIEEIYSSTKDLLDAVSSPEKTSTFNLAQAMQQAVAEFSKNISFEEGNRIPIDHQYYKKEHFVVANEPIIRTALYNFLTNISRYASDTERIVADVNQKENRIVASIADYGSHPALNIKETPDASKEFIFAKGTSGGSGLGDAMYITQERMKQYGGIVDVDFADKEKKRGSVFSLVFPLTTK